MLIKVSKNYFYELGSKCKVRLNLKENEIYIKNSSQYIKNESEYVKNVKSAY